MVTQVSPEQIEKARAIEKTISDNDGASIRSRWAFGRYMLTLIPEGRKQLPKGVLATFGRALKVNRSELSARMKFAAKFPSEGELSETTERFGSWYRITREALTDKPRTSKSATATRQVIRLLQGFDAAELSDEEILDINERLADVIAGNTRVLNDRRKEAA